MKTRAGFLLELVPKNICLAATFETRTQRRQRQAEHEAQQAKHAPLQWLKTLYAEYERFTLRVCFTEEFQSRSSRDVLPREQLQKRLLLSLYVLGTNTGLMNNTVALLELVRLV